MLDTEKKNRWKRIISILKLCILFGIVIGVPVLVYFIAPEIIDNFKSVDDINTFLDHYSTASLFIYIGLQIVQIVISAIPGQMIQFAAGYAFPFYLAYIASIVGIALGTTLTFYMARLLGKDAIHVLFGERRINEYIHMLNSKKAYIVIFILYVIPGFPKDLIGFAAGVSDIRFRPYLVLSLVGRSPALIATILMGSMTRTGSYFGLIVLAVLACVLFLICVLKRKQLAKLPDLIYKWMSAPKKKRTLFSGK